MPQVKRAMALPMRRMMKAMTVTVTVTVTAVAMERVGPTLAPRRNLDPSTPILLTVTAHSRTMTTLCLVMMRESSASLTHFRVRMKPRLQPPSRLPLCVARRHAVMPTCSTYKWSTARTPCATSSIRACLAMFQHRGGFFRQIVEGLAYIHGEGITHRDLKPQNLFLLNGNIKIGDFGLATSTTGAGRDTVVLNHQRSIEMSASAAGRRGPEDASDNADSMASGAAVGTTFYVSPELMRLRAGMRYSQKVDLYSLGIIFFEMCHAIGTGMERATVLGELRRKEVVFPSDFDKGKLASQATIIARLLDHDPRLRPTATELLESELLPPKIEDESMKEVTRLLTQRNTPAYNRLMGNLFSQPTSKTREYTYDLEIAGDGLGQRSAFVRARVKERIARVFARHGGIELETSLLSPLSDAHRHANEVVLMDHAGGLVSLPYDHTVPFARRIARQGIQTLRRFAFGRVYRDIAADCHPRELYECCFDIVEHSAAGLVPDAEVARVASEVISEFGLLKERRYRLRVNHAALVTAIMSACGVGPAEHASVSELLAQTARMDMSWRKTRNVLVRQGRVSPIVADAIGQFVTVRGDMDTLAKTVRLLTTRQMATAALTQVGQGLRDLRRFQELVAAFGLEQPVLFDLGLLVNANLYSGIIFAFVADPEQDGAGTSGWCARGDIIAHGGRYDALVAEFRPPTSRLSAPGAVGVIIDLSKITSMEMATESMGKKHVGCADVLVCSVGKTSVDDRILIARELWGANIRAEVAYDVAHPPTVDAMQARCREAGIPWMIVLKDRSLKEGAVRVRNVELRTESEVSRRDVCEFVSLAMRSRRARDPVTAGDGQGEGHHHHHHHDHAQGVADAGESVRTARAAEVKVSVLPRDKLQSHRRKRVQGLAAERVATVTRGGSGGRPVLAVDLPGPLVRLFAASADVSNRDSIKTVCDANPRFRDHIAEMWEFLVAASTDAHVVFLYSYRDDVLAAVIVRVSRKANS
eukprot:Opistho-2@80053